MGGAPGRKLVTQVTGPACPAGKPRALSDLQERPRKGIIGIFCFSWGEPAVRCGVILRQRKAILRLSRKNNVVFFSVGCRIHGISKKEKLTLWLGWLLVQVSVRAHVQLAGLIPGGRVCRSSRWMFRSHINVSPSLSSSLSLSL